MEKKFFKEVTIVLLPPLLNQLELNSKNTIFLNLGDIVNSNSYLAGLDEKTKKIPSTLINKVAKNDLSKEIINLIDSKSREVAFAKVMLINYPMIKSQLEKLEKTFESAGLNISRLVVTSLPSFDVLVTAKEKNFLCPICFKCYAKKVFLKQDRYLCPLDKEDFSVSYIDEFTEYLTTCYLQNSIEVIQSFAEDEKEKGRKILNFSVDSEDNLTENMKKSLLSIAEEK